MMMQVQVTSQTGAGGSDSILLMFHDYGNDESEMMRILDVVYAPTRADMAPAATAAIPSCISFRATYAKLYISGGYWYPGGCGVDERQREYVAVGDAVTLLLDIPTSVHRRKILVGFSQDGYLLHHLVKVRPTLLGTAILFSPSFVGEEQAALDSPTQFFLAYGMQDRTVPLPDQQTAHQVLKRAGYLAYREYSGMAHIICDEEIANVRSSLHTI